MDNHGREYSNREQTTSRRFLTLQCRVFFEGRKIYSGRDDSLETLRGSLSRSRRPNRLRYDIGNNNDTTGR